MPTSEEHAVAMQRIRELAEQMSHTAKHLMDAVANAEDLQEQHRVEHEAGTLEERRGTDRT